MALALGDLAVVRVVLVVLVVLVLLVVIVVIVVIVVFVVSIMLIACGLMFGIRCCDNVRSTSSTGPLWVVAMGGCYGWLSWVVAMGGC